VANHRKISSVNSFFAFAAKDRTSIYFKISVHKQDSFHLDLGQAKVLRTSSEVHLAIYQSGDTLLDLHFCPCYL
jgi:hypothetical protein